MTSGTTAAQTLFDYDVVDSAGNRIGSVDNVWADDATNEAEFVGIKTGWLFGKTHVVPVADAQIGGGTITVPYTSDQVKDAPSFGADEELSPGDEDEIYGYFGVQRSTAQSPTGLPAGGRGRQYQSGTVDTLDTTDTSRAEMTAGYDATGDNEADMTLSAEELAVGKRQVEAGRVRLRKVVRTEHQEIPVDLKREDIEIERVPAGEAGAPSDAFQEEEVEVPVMREEPVVAKEARVTGGVRVSKDIETETTTVGDEVRKEDVEVDRDVEAGTTTDRPY
jgi:uncharacterized protein (TIGR02271 family)